MPVREAEHKRWEPTKPGGYWHDDSRFKPEEVTFEVRKRWAAYTESKVDVSKLEINFDASARADAGDIPEMARLAHKIGSFTKWDRPTTPDGYSWWMSLNFRIHDSDVAILLPWCAEWRNSGPDDESLRLDRHMMVMSKGAVSGTELQDIVDYISSGIEDLTRHALGRKKAKPRNAPKEEELKADAEGFEYVERKLETSCSFCLDYWLPLHFKSIPYEGNKWEVVKTLNAVGYFIKETYENAGGQIGIYRIRNREEKMLAIVKSVLVKEGVWLNRVLFEKDFIIAVNVYDTKMREMWKQEQDSKYNKKMLEEFNKIMDDLERG